MPQINTGSDLLETLLTPQEVNTAMQFMDKSLSICYLQNSRIAIFRQLAEQQFSNPAEDAEQQRVRAYFKGQYDLLGTLLEGAINPTPIPVGDSQPQQ